MNERNAHEKKCGFINYERLQWQFEVYLPK